MRAPLIGALAAAFALATALTLATVGAHAMGQAPDERYTVHLPQLTVAGGDPDQEAIAEAAAGLLYPSETDAPLVAFTAPPTASPSSAAACLALAGDKPVRVIDPAAFLGAPARAEPWMSPGQLATAARFARLRDTFLARLTSPAGCRVGGVEADVYLIGVSSRGTIVGLRTLIVET